MTSTTYQVTGLTCEHCVRAVTEEFEGLAGVSAVTVDLVPGGLSAVTVTSDAPVPAAAVEAALDEAGAYRLADNATPVGGVPAPSSARAPSPARALPLA